MASAIEVTLDGIAPDRVFRREVARERFDRRDDDGNAARHGLQHAEPESFLDRDERERGREAVKARHVAVGDDSEQAHGSRRLAHRGEARTEFPLVFAVVQQARAASDDQLRVRADGEQSRERIEKVERVLALLDAADA